MTHDKDYNLYKDDTGRLYRLEWCKDCAGYTPRFQGENGLCANCKGKKETPKNNWCSVCHLQAFPCGDCKGKITPLDDPFPKLKKKKPPIHPKEKVKKKGLDQFF